MEYHLQKPIELDSLGARRICTYIYESSKFLSKINQLKFTFSNKHSNLHLKHTFGNPGTRQKTIKLSQFEFFHKVAFSTHLGNKLLT